MNNSVRFSHFARTVAAKAGNPMTFLLAVGIILIWVVSGPLFDFSETWQLIINTGTTIITFLMIFLVQNTQNRDSAAIQVKLDELIRATRGAHNALLEIEDLSYEQLEVLHARYEQLARRAKQRLVNGRPDTDTPQVMALTDGLGETSGGGITPKVIVHRARPAKKTRASSGGARVMTSNGRNPPRGVAKRVRANPNPSKQAGRAVPAKKTKRSATRTAGGK